jgi:hypothetical protein
MQVTMVRGTGWNARHRGVCTLLAGAFAAACLAGPAVAAEQTVLGRKLVVKNPQPADPSQRSVSALAIERGSGAPLNGDPTVVTAGAGGAVLEIAALGTATSSQLFSLDQGTRADGQAFWRRLGSRGFAYSDPHGERGPVKSVKITRSQGGTLRLSASLRGENGALDIVPPNPGTSGFIALTLSAGDRYCAGFGAGSRITNRGDELWKVGSVTAESCAPRPTLSGEFLALSYNVAGLPEPLSGSEPLTNTPIISPLLNAYDVVVVQESWQTPDPNPLAPLRVYHELLVADADHPYKTVALDHPFNMNPERPAAIIADGLAMFSRFPFTGVVHEYWDTCWPSAADCLAIKGFMVSRTTIAPGVTIDIYDLHMEAGGDPEDETARSAGIAQLSAFMNVYSAGRAVIVGGDFNLHTNEEPDSTQFQALLAATGLSDVCATLACPQPGRIDKFVFRSGGGITITPQSWQFETDVFVDPMGDPLSDHDALAVRFSWLTSD